MTKITISVKIETHIQINLKSLLATIHDDINFCA